MDTCALTWFARQPPDGVEQFRYIVKNYHVLVPTPVLYELAFGVPGTADDKEVTLRSMLFRHEKCIEMREFAHALRGGGIRPGAFSIVNPGFNEWRTARDRALIHIGLSGATARVTKRDLSMDALIHACARNSFAPVCTTNLDDFVKLNRAGDTRIHDRTVPLVTPEELMRSVADDVVCHDV